MSPVRLYVSEEIIQIGKDRHYSFAVAELTDERHRVILTMTRVRSCIRELGKTPEMIYVLIDWQDE